MLDAFLIPANSAVTAKGDSQALDISPAVSRIFLVTLSIGVVVEQEAIDVFLYTSADGTAWEGKPVAAIEQKFYPGEYPLLIDLSQRPEAKFVRAHWDVYRWGRGPTAAQFEISLRVREVSEETMREAEAEAELSQG